MRPLRAWVTRLFGTLGPRARCDADLAAELDSHLQLHTDDNVRAGMAPEEARRAALIRMGGVERVKEDVRERRSLRLLDQFARDLRLASRQLRTGTSLSALAMLAIAIGLTTAMFAVVDALLIRPVPFRDADRLLSITLFGEHGGRLQVAPAILRAWRENHAFDAVEGGRPDTAVIDAGAGPDNRSIAYVASGLFDMLGIRPVRGRLFGTARGDAADQDSAIVSEDLWRTMFSADPSIIGRRFRFNQEDLQVIGVLPAGVHFPEWNTQVWRPRDFDAPALKRADWPFAYLRLRAGVPLPEAVREATETAHRTDPASKDLHAVPHPLSGESNEKYYLSAMPLLGGGVALVFFALCANVSCLLLARFSAQRRQFDLCSALGASRGRLLGQAFVEAAAIAVLGCGLGILIARELTSLAAAVLPETFLSQTLRPLRIDGTALALATGLGGVATLVTGLLPAWTTTRSARALGAGTTSRTSTESRGGRSLTRILLVAEVTFACALLIGAGLLTRSFVNLTRMDIGFQPRGLMTVAVFFVGPRNQRGPAVTAADGELRALPGIQQVVWSGGAPSAPAQTDFGKYQSDTAGESVDLEIQDFFVSPDFFQIYGIKLLRGRSFQPNEEESHVIVGERLANVLWPGIDPVGHSFKSWSGDSFHVVGVAKEPRRALIGADAVRDYPTLYRPALADNFYGTATLRCVAACPSEGVVRARLLPLGAAIQAVRVKYLEEVYRQDLAQPRATAIVSGIFAAVALLAAAGGLFSVLHYAVGRRRREFGIRAALGSSSAAIGRLVIRDSAVVMATGLALGVLLAWLLGRSLASLEYGVTATDPLTWGLVIAALAAAGLAASWWPARSAMRVNPVELLRED